MQFGENILPPPWHGEFKNFSCNDHQIQNMTFAVDMCYFPIVFLFGELPLSQFMWSCWACNWDWPIYVPYSSVTVISAGIAYYPCSLVLCALVDLIFFFPFLRFLLFPRRMLSSNLPWIIRVDCEIYLKYHLKFKMPLHFVIGIDCIFHTISS